ncbi:C-X-C motif chemokine 11 [Varanus komodoensis]|nr:C-X-C motif chemokine 11 [Varanus komodoensis]
MIKKSILAILIFLLCTALIQGMPTSGRGRCLCHGRSVTLVRMSNVAKVEFHPPSSSCDQEELIYKRKGNYEEKEMKIAREKTVKVPAGISFQWKMGCDV